LNDFEFNPGLGEPGSGQDQVGLELEQAEQDNSTEPRDKDSKREKKAKTFYSKVCLELYTFL
jgi:hypothetical protein